jgi:DNA polymerase-3 subunit gamma/tau
MFENIIEQSAALQLKEDILGKKNAPSLLFFGPSESGKGSAAIELARSLSCEKDASWKCACPSCEKFRHLQHDDLLILGKKSFACEIKACHSAFLNNPSNAGAKLLFFRSLRKLQMRFSPVLTEDDPKLGKITPILLSLDEGLSELLQTDETSGASFERLCNSLVKDALSLSDEGISSNIPVSRIRKASYWCRLSPTGKQKTLIMENAQDMRDEARNSLLKLLEEPPASVTVVLTSQRRETIMPTILSRLRPYRFVKRSAEGEKEVLRRVFQYSASGFSSVSAYLDSFLEGSGEKLYPLAVWFIDSLAKINSAQLIKTLLAKSGNFEGDSFSRFLKICLDLTAASSGKANDPRLIRYNDMFGKHIGQAAAAVDVLNQSIPLALEALLYNLKTAIKKTG